MIDDSEIDPELAEYNLDQYDDDDDDNEGQCKISFFFISN
jgi:hypothetical protein